MSRDWPSFAPPYRGWERSIDHVETVADRRIADAIGEARDSGLLDAVSREWLGFLRGHMQVGAFVSKATKRALEHAADRCPWPVIARCVQLTALTHERQALALVLHALELEAVAGVMPVDEARTRWHEDPAWQDARSVLGQLERTDDWCEATLVVNLAFEPLVGVLLRREFGIAAAGAFDDPVTPAVAEAGQLEYEWTRDWTIALVRFLLDDPEHGDRNRRVIDGWIAAWTPDIERAAEDAAALAGQLLPGFDPATALARVRGDQRRLLSDAGLVVAA